MKTISTKDLHARMTSTPTAIFDVRGDIEYELEHLPGAKTAPLGALVLRVASMMRPDTFVAVYTQNAECALAEEAARRLENLGLREVHVYTDGIDGWKANGKPTVASRHPKAHARGPVVDCRSVVVDRQRAYGGVFSQPPTNTVVAGG